MPHAARKGAIVNALAGYRPAHMKQKAYLTHHKCARTFRQASALIIAQSSAERAGEPALCAVIMTYLYSNWGSDLSNTENPNLREDRLILGH